MPCVSLANLAWFGKGIGETPVHQTPFQAEHGLLAVTLSLSKDPERSRGELYCHPELDEGTASEGFTTMNSPVSSGTAI